MSVTKLKRQISSKSSDMKWPQVGALQKRLFSLHVPSTNGGFQKDDCNSNLRPGREHGLC